MQIAHRGADLRLGGSSSRLPVSAARVAGRRCPAHRLPPVKTALVEPSADAEGASPLVEGPLPATLCPPISAPLQEGDYVYGRVISSNGKGARVQLMFSHDGVVGFMPADQAPIKAPWCPAHYQRNKLGHGSRSGPQRRQSRPPAQASMDEQPQPKDSAAASEQAGPRTTSHSNNAVPMVKFGTVPVGHVRAFKVKSIPKDMGQAVGSGGAAKGPLLSAHEHDGDLYLVRMQQLKEMGDETKSSFKATVVGANDAGVLFSLAGFGAAFMPWRYLSTRPPPGGPLGAQGYPMWNQALVMQHLKGSTLDVGIVEVIGDERKVIVSEQLARSYRQQRVLQLGNVVEGTVHTVREFGAFVQLDALHDKAHALLRCERISQVQLNKYNTDCREFFQPGDRVVGLVSLVETDAKGPRIQISTMELEQEPGDMLSGPERRNYCYDLVRRFIVR